MNNQLAELRALIADDSYAITFQTFGQYRTALLKACATLAQAGAGESAELDAKRWRFFNEHANDWIDGKQFGVWLSSDAVMKHGSRNAAIDAALAGSEVKP